VQIGDVIDVIGAGMHSSRGDGNQCVGERLQLRLRRMPMRRLHAGEGKLRRRRISPSPPTPPHRASRFKPRPCVSRLLRPLP
jgi:hypothetical protein